MNLRIFKTDGAKKLEEMVSKYNNDAKNCSTLPGMIFSTYNTTLFVFKGVASKSWTWYLLNGQDITNIKKPGKLI